MWYFTGRFLAFPCCCYGFVVVGVGVGADLTDGMIEVLLKDVYAHEMMLLSGT